jgi:hypothetical protein
MTREQKAGLRLARDTVRDILRDREDELTDVVMSRFRKGESPRERALAWEVEKLQTVLDAFSVLFPGRA